MDIQIRKAKWGDLPALVELWVEFMQFHAEIDPGYDLLDDAPERWVDYIRPKFEDKDWCVLVADCSGDVIGYTVATIQDYPPVFQRTTHGFVQEIAVQAAHRHSGVGSRLVEAAETWLRSKGVPEITVRIDERNPASKALFSSRGFEPWVVVRRKIISDSQ